MRNGVGTYVLPAGQPVVTGATISSSAHNTLANDLANALTTSIATDGQSVVTANIPFAGYKLTGVGAATVNGDVLCFQQLFSQGLPVSVASAATTDIGAQTSVAVEISGTTTITSFGIKYNGPRFLRFAGALLLTHNATTLNLPGGRDITTRAGDTAIAYPNLAVNGWNVVSYQQASSPPALGQCRLTLFAGSLKLLPFNGNLLTVNGVACTIPDAGVTLAASGLSATTLYYIYAVATAGAISSLEASTTGHGPDTTAGNKGVEIKTGDATRSLVGMAYVKTAATFADTTQQRLVRSWFNDSGIAGTGVFNANISYGSAVYAEISPSIRSEFALWLGESVSFSFTGTTSNNSAGNSVYSGVGFDNTSNVEFGANFGYSVTVAVGIPVGVGGVKQSLAEGFHYITAIGKPDAGTATWVGGASAHGCQLSFSTRK